MKPENKIYRFIRVRLVGIVELVEALLRIVFREKAPNLTLKVMVWEAGRNVKRYYDNLAKERVK